MSEAIGAAEAGNNKDLETGAVEQSDPRRLGNQCVETKINIFYPLIIIISNTSKN